MHKVAIFKFEASSVIGAGHAIRSTALAKALIKLGWDCQIATSLESYDLIPQLRDFKRIDPSEEIEKLACDLLIIDNYQVSEAYELSCKEIVKKIMVVDDLANRKHECDYLLDQTASRKASEYSGLVPQNCKLFFGSDYALIREEIVRLRQKSLAKRRTNKLERILVSVGGVDQHNFSLQALQMISQSEFKGAIDIVLGFNSPHLNSIKDQIAKMPNGCQIHVNADMPKLMFEADLAIGAAGSSVWERACLGLPQFLIETADNQVDIFNSFKQASFVDFYEDCQNGDKEDTLVNKLDGLGVIRLANYLNNYQDKFSHHVYHERVKMDDLNLTFSWMQDPRIREFSFNKSTPSYAEHKEWFSTKINNPEVIFEKIIVAGVPCGTVRLDYNYMLDSWYLSWYIIPEYQNKGIGLIALLFAIGLAMDKPIKAKVFSENIASRMTMNKAGFKIESQNNEIIQYVY